MPGPEPVDPSVERMTKHAINHGVEWMMQQRGSVLVGEWTTGKMMELAAWGAVITDRSRMADQLRLRVIRNNDPGFTKLPAEITMKIDELLLDLADQIEKGMPVRPTDEQ